MSFSPEIEQRLKEAGYKHHCFISYPRVPNKEVVKFVRRVREAIRGELSLSVNNPSVFLDESIETGSRWKPTLKEALCQSLTMVAICAPIYYHPERPWCGLEWATMEELKRRRLPHHDELGTIIPIILREAQHQPKIVSDIQWINISNESLVPGFYTSGKFNRLVRRIVNHIEKVSDVLVGDADNVVRTNCQDFQFPLRSAFEECQEVEPPAPFYGNA
jgi:hypothetical protein